MWMALSDWELAARYLEFPEYILVKVTKLVPDWHQIWYQAHPDELPILTGIGTTGPGHFPYGELVEPDQ